MAFSNYQKDQNGPVPENCEKCLFHIIPKTWTTGRKQNFSKTLATVMVRYNSVGSKIPRMHRNSIYILLPIFWVNRLRWFQILSADSKSYQWVDLTNRSGDRICYNSKSSQVLTISRFESFWPAGDPNGDLMSFKLNNRLVPHGTSRN